MTNRHRLLVVDDDPLNTLTLSEIFSLKGYQVDTANSGPDALEKVRNQDYSCVLSDIKMDKMNGVELLIAVRAIKPSLPFILMTAYSDDDLILQGIREGALITLIKPLDIERLLGHVARILKIDALN